MMVALGWFGAGLLLGMFLVWFTSDPRRPR